MAQINVFDVNQRLDERIEKMVEYFYDFFEPIQGDTFSILDPYLEPVIHLQQPFDENKDEQNFWSFFLGMIAGSDEEINFRIITRQLANGLKNPDEYYPKRIINPSKLKKVKIEICCFKDGIFNKHSLHDRWIIKKSQSNRIIGIHVGPSLCDIDKKDATITIFSDNTVQEAINRFNHLWNICLRKNW